VGAIADRAKAYIPISWDGLSGDPRYGTTMLQGRINRAKYEVLGAGYPVENAEVTIPEDQIEHIAKRAVVKVIPAAIEFWVDKPISKNTSGTAEIVSYESRVQSLRTLFIQLQQEIAVEEPTVTPILQTSGFPAVSDGENEILVTENPHTFPPAWTRGGGVGTEEV
jgi:hypothetical protein